MDGFSQTTTVEASILLENVGVADFKMQGKGFGKLIIKLFIETYSGMIKKSFRNNFKQKPGFIKSFKLYSDIDPDNIASIKIHLNNGFLPAGTYKYPNGKIYNRYVYSFFSK